MHPIRRLGRLHHGAVKAAGALRSIRIVAAVAATILAFAGSPVATVAAGAVPIAPALSAAVPAPSAPAPGSTASTASYRHGAVAPVGSAPAAVGSAAANGKSSTANAGGSGGASGTTFNNLSFGGGVDGIGVTTGSPKVYLVFWGSQWGMASTDSHGDTTFSGDPQGMAPYLQALFAGIGTGGETWSGVTTEYCEAVPATSQTCPPYASHVGYPVGGALAGVWADAANPAPAAASATDLAIEAVNAAKHFGNTTQAANRSTQYFIVSPTGTNPDGFDGGGGGFCAWHDFTADPSLPGGGAPGAAFAAAFTNLPYVTDAGRSCGTSFVNAGSAGALDGVSIVAGHEYAETLTDQFPAGGWVDQQGQEIGDKCAWIPAGSAASAQDVAFTTGTFAMQSLWANDASGGSGGCLISHPIVVDNDADVAPVITSAATATFAAAVPGSFTVSATGLPAPSLTESGALPSGVSFVDNHDRTAVLSGTASAAAEGSYPISITAANGIGANAVQKFTLTIRQRGGAIVNFAGNQGGSGGLSGDGGPAAAALLSWPYGLAADSTGDLYISDCANNRVRKVDPSGIITTFAGGGSGVSLGSGGPATDAHFYCPDGLAVDKAGNVYIAVSSSNQILKVDTSGILTVFAGTGYKGNTGDGGAATAATFDMPYGVAVDSAGNVYIVDTFNNRVRKVDSSGIVTNFAGNPAGTAGNTGDNGPATLASLDFPFAAAADSAGNVYIADKFNDRVRKVDPSGTITDFAGRAAGTNGDTGDGGPATSALLNEPVGLAVDPSGSVYIASYDRIREVDPSGVIHAFAGTGALGNDGDGGAATDSTMNNPQAPAVDPAGDVFIADWLNNRVREVPAQAPSIISAAAATFPVGVAASFSVTASGFPSPSITETGALPPGVTFDSGSATLRGTPAQGSAGAYPLTLSAGTGIGPPAVQSFTLSVDQATMSYPADGQANVDTTRPFTWSPIPEAQGYLLTVGRALYGANLVNSGILPASQASFPIPALPAGVALHATLYAEVNGTWTSFQAIIFTAAQVQASFTFPLAGATGVDPTRAFSWATNPQAQAYLLIVGTSRYAYNVANSGILPPTTSTFAGTVLPAGVTLYATLFTEVNGAFTGVQSITFTAGAAEATFTRPTSGQANVAAPATFTWTTIATAQSYYLLLGTSMYGRNVLDSGLLAATKNSYAVAALPHHTVVYASLFTEVNRTWVVQEITFTTS